MVDRTMVALRHALNDLADLETLVLAIEVLLPNDTDSDQARAACRGARALASNAISSAYRRVPGLDEAGARAGLPSPAMAASHEVTQ